MAITTSKLTTLAQLQSLATVVKSELDKKYDASKVGTLPQGYDTVMAYIAAVKTEAEDHYDDTELAGKVSTLIGSDADKSARAIAAEEVAAQLIPENAAEALDTLQEIAAWIQAHPGDASAMNSAISALQTKVTLGVDGENKEYATVKAYVEAAIAALQIGDYAKAADLTAAVGRISTLEGDSHTHANKTVLDGITAEKVALWDAALQVSDVPVATDAEVTAMINTAFGLTQE